MDIPNSGFSDFNSLLLRSGSRGWFCPAASRWRCTALPGGHSLSGFDSGLVCGPWRRTAACWGSGWICLRPRFWSGRFLGWGMALGAIPSVSLFLLQKILYPTLGPPRRTNGGILDPVAAVVIGLPMLGGIPKLAPQAFCAIVQPSADKLFRRCLDFLFQTFLFLTLFLDFFDVLSPHVSRNRAVSQTPTARFLLKIYTLYCFQHHSAIFAINSSGSGSRYGIRMVPLLVSYSDSLSRNLSTASGPG